MSRALGLLLRASRRSTAPSVIYRSPTIWRSYTSGFDQPAFPDPAPHPHPHVASGGISSSVIKEPKTTPPPVLIQSTVSSEFTEIPEFDDVAYQWMPETDTPELSHVTLNRTNIQVGTGLPRSFNYSQLRDACKCPICVDQYSRQRNFRLMDIPTRIRPRAIRWQDSTLFVQWKDDIPGFPSDHTSTYPLSFLLHPNSNNSYGMNDTLHMLRTPWSAQKMQRDQHWITYDDWMNDEDKFAMAMRQLAASGLIFVQNIPQSREMVEKIAQRMGPLRNSFYGQTWDVRSVPQAKNVAYTSQFLGFHMDLLYMANPPGYQLLHCLENSCEGGESLFTDGFRAAVTLRRLKPSIYQRLVKFRLNYEYNHEDHFYQHSWPIIEESGSGSHVTRVNYSPPFQAPLAGRPGIRDRAMGNLKEALSRFNTLLEEPSAVFELKLEPGQCVIFANRRVLHARRQFNTNTGSRWLAGAYVDGDALRSKFITLMRKDPELWSPPPPPEPPMQPPAHQPSSEVP